MPAHMENSALATGLKKVSFHSNPKERQCQRIFKLLYNCTHFIYQQGNTQNPLSQVSRVHELRMSRCSSWIQKRQRNQRSNCQHALDHRKSKEFQKNIYFCFTDCAKAFDYVDHNKLWKILQDMGISDHLTCLLRNPLQVKKQQLEPDMEQWTDSQLGKGYDKAVHCHPAYLTSMLSRSGRVKCWAG